ncbi:hypothetical protein FXO37_27031 [Capsicum annuum]|nr:hypothetical protein FXO37_27031 [Capsicum annuum]
MRREVTGKVEAVIFAIDDKNSTAAVANEYNFVMSTKLGVCQGLLQFFQVTRSPSIHVWELEDYIMGKWTKLHRGVTPTNVFDVLAFHPNKEDLICA